MVSDVRARGRGVRRMLRTVAAALAFFFGVHDLEGVVEGNEWRMFVGVHGCAAGDFLGICLCVCVKERVFNDRAVWRGRGRTRVM